MANKQEKIKKEKHPLAVWPDIERYAREGFAAISEDDFERFKWYGIYRQRPMDGFFMLRIKLPNGDIKGNQLKVVGEIANRYGRGLGDFTTRQDIQLHWIRIEEILEIMARLHRVKLTTLGACGDVARNLVGCPVAGVDGEELIDASPIVKEVSNFFLGNKEFADLPRKFKISITGCIKNCTKPEIQCVALVAVRRGDDVGFDLRVGGGLSSQPHLGVRLNAYVTRDQVLPVIRSIAVIFRDSDLLREKRHHARLKFLVAEWGPKRFREELEASMNVARRVEERMQSIRDSLERESEWGDPNGNERLDRHDTLDRG